MLILGAQSSSYSHHKKCTSVIDDVGRIAIHLCHLYHLGPGDPLNVRHGQHHRFHLEHNACRVSIQTLAPCLLGADRLYSRHVRFCYTGNMGLGLQAGERTIGPESVSAMSSVTPSKYVARLRPEQIVAYAPRS
jgi:hypothetical protein